MGPSVILRVQSGDFILRPGDLVGRHWRCALVVADQRVSEAHAMVSLRGGSLRLLGLRGGMAIHGEVVTDPVLFPGLLIELAPELVVEVREVHLPDSQMALEGPGLLRTSLSGTMSLYVRPPRQLVPGYRPDADAWFYDDGERWYLAEAARQEGPLQVGSDLTIGGWTGRLVDVPLPASPATLQAFPQAPEPLRLELWFDDARVFRSGELVLHLTGRRAQLLSELARIGAPIDWEAAAREVWPRAHERWALRKRWDATLGRLRRALADAGVRSDLLATDGRGLVSMVLYPSDELALMD